MHVPHFSLLWLLRHLDAPDIYCPPELHAPLEKILKTWAEIEDYETKYFLRAVEYGRTYALQKNFYFRAIRSVHRIASNGYTILEKTIKLKKEFLSLPGKDIARMRKERDDLFEEVYHPIVTFSGDTQIEFVLDNEIVRQSKILFLECTYVDDKRPVERARKWGHIHLDEIAANAAAFENVERLFLIHFSPRYRSEEIRSALKAKLPDWLHAKTTPFI
ncbi:MAG: MBL fold metallo-hydrolase [Spirochaetia bacterium]|nr:MBL fold metallo-hydrolase [Spirochaetia bacterium]